MQEGFIPVRNAELFYRQIGEGQPIIIIHGGPDFDHTYLLPDMDRLSDSYRLVYYDQRGRGRSRGELRLEEISIEQTVEDLKELMDHLRLESSAILGHSWGGHVAIHYAVRHPERVSHMILMNTAPAAFEDYLLFRQERLSRLAAYAEKLDRLKASTEYQAGDPETVRAYYRILYGTTIKRPEHLERLNLSWTQEDILGGRAVEEQLMKGLFWSEGFTLFAQLQQLHTRTLVIHGDYDFVPLSCAAHIADAIPGALLIFLKDCGHFSYIEAPEEVHKAIDSFLTKEDP